MSNDEFEETPEETLVSFAKMILAASGYSVSERNGKWAAIARGHGVDRPLPRRKGHDGPSRVATWARCADDWVAQHTWQPRKEVISELTSLNQSKGDPEPKNFRPPLPEFPEWPA